MAKRRPPKLRYPQMLPSKWPIITTTTTAEPIPDETSAVEILNPPNIWSRRGTELLPEDEEDEEQYAADTYSRTPWELIEKLVRDRLHLTGRSVFYIGIIGWLGVVSWIFVQDNSAGKLDSQNGLVWFAIKAASFAALIILALLLMLLLERTFKSGRPIRGGKY